MCTGAPRLFRIKNVDNPKSWKNQSCIHTRITRVTLHTWIEIRLNRSIYFDWVLFVRINRGPPVRIYQGPPAQWTYSLQNWRVSWIRSALMWVPVGLLGLMTTRPFTRSPCNNQESKRKLAESTPHSHRTRDKTRNASKWDLCGWMGVFTLHASNIKGFAFEFAGARSVWITQNSASCVLRLRVGTCGDFTPICKPLTLSFASWRPCSNNCLLYVNFSSGFLAFCGQKQRKNLSVTFKTFCSVPQHDQRPMDQTFHA